MTEYRFHLQKYRPGSKTACPECGRKSCFTRYIDEAGEISFPDNVGICDHINSCGYHYTPKEYFRDNPTVKEKLNEQERNSGTPIAARPPARALPEQKPRISFLPSVRLLTAGTALGFMDAVHSCRYSFIRRVFMKITLRRKEEFS